MVPSFTPTSGSALIGQADNANIMRRSHEARQAQLYGGSDATELSYCCIHLQAQLEETRVRPLTSTDTTTTSTRPALTLIMASDAKSH